MIKLKEQRMIFQKFCKKIGLKGPPKTIRQLQSGQS